MHQNYLAWVWHPVSNISKTCTVLTRSGLANTVPTATDASSCLYTNMQCMLIGSNYEFHIIKVIVLIEL